MSLAKAPGWARGRTGACRCASDSTFYFRGTRAALCPMPSPGHHTPRHFPVRSPSPGHCLLHARGCADCIRHEHAAWTYLPPTLPSPPWEADVSILLCTTYWHGVKTPSRLEAPKHKIQREIRSPLMFRVRMDGWGISCFPHSANYLRKPAKKTGSLSPITLKTLGTGDTKSPVQA